MIRYLERHALWAIYLTLLIVVILLYLGLSQ